MRFTVGSDGENEQSIVHPRNAVLLRVDTVDDGQQVVFVAELSVKVDDDGGGCAIQLSGAIEKRAQCANEDVVPSRTQLCRKVGTRIVEQRDQPAGQLQRASTKSWTLAVRTILIVSTTGHIQIRIMCYGPSSDRTSVAILTELSF